MDGGFSSEARQTREAVIELAHTVGLLLVSLSELDMAFSRMHLAMIQGGNLTSEQFQELEKAKAKSDEGDATRKEVYQGLVKILTDLGAANG